MHKIHVVGNAFSYRVYHHPIRIFQKQLLDLGLKVKFFHSVSAPNIDECDVLIFHEDNYRDILPIVKKERNAAIDFLQTYFEKFSRVIWFDGNDGSGWLRSYVFPLVDLYVKSQVLRDTTYYTKPHPTGVMHRDYAVENYHCQDPLIAKDTLTPADCEKLRVSWGRAYHIRNHFNMPFIQGFIDHLPPHKNNYHYSLPNLTRRSHIIQYRVNYWERFPTVNWWRTRTLQELEGVIHQNSPYQLAPTGKTSFPKYLKELRNSVVTVSPFGLNEKCVRDIWSFVSGSLLYKPSLDHMQTFPDYYFNGETYIAHAWDFSDFAEKLDDILIHPGHYENIAQAGQDHFKRAIIDGDGFAKHFLEMIS